MRRGVVIIFISYMLSLLPCVVQAQRSNASLRQLQKLNRVYGHLQNHYVDSVDMQPLVESAIRGMLEKLDPHSTYLNEAEMKSEQENFNGEFSGIGVEYNILNDTIIVVGTVAQGPAESVGVMPNDRIVEIDGENVVGVSRNEVPPKLRGEKGSVVNVGIVRRGVQDMLYFAITRNKIPITTVDAAYLAADKTGYIKVNRFGHTTMQEFREAVEGLGDIDALILDLDNNGGGLLEQAVEMAGYFLPKKSLIVSTEGRVIEPQYYYAKDGGLFDGRLVVMINENSASGSEIVAGAVQDWDRGVLVGHDSFGKGLVQSQIPLGDGSAIRLTVARYHTPSGRTIQRPYERGHKEEYYKAHAERLQSVGRDTLSSDLRKEYRTLRSGRVVYADGGIKPDVVVGRDTTLVSDYMVKIIAQGVYSDFVLDYLDKHRSRLEIDYPTFEKFDVEFDLADEDMCYLTERAKAKGIAFDNAGFEQSRQLMKIQLSAMIAQRLYSVSEYYQYINPRVSESYKKSLWLLNNWKSEAEPLLK